VEPRVRPAAPASRGSLTAVERRLMEEGGIADCVLVTGAAGYLGRRIASALARCGAQVRGLVRDPSSVPWELEADAEIIGGNLVDPASLRKAMRNVDLVVHCAAVTKNNAPWVLHQQTNIEGTRAVLEAAQEAGVRRLVHVSSVIVYGLSGSPSRPLPESAPAPDDVNRWAFYLRSKLGAEQVLTNSSPDGTEVVVVRPGIIYGPGRPPSFGLLQLGSSRITVGRGANHLPYTYVDNVVDGILLALTVHQAAGEIYNLVDEPTVEARFVQLRMAEIAGKPIRLLPIAPAPLNILAAALERRHEQKGAGVPPPISRFHVASATQNLRHDVSKAKQELGWLPEVRLDEGLRRTVSTSAE
jgi:2-alkyl-3-oxoalkanoate reductase